MLRGLGGCCAPPAAAWQCPRSVLVSSVGVAAARGIFADKVRAGHILKDQGKYWRCVSNSKSQKGQGAASFNLRLCDVATQKIRDAIAPPGKDFPEARTERLKMLFSGFDESDMACFVYPQHAALAGKEVNIPATTLSETLQKFLACGMPVDILHIHGDEEEAAASGGAAMSDLYCDLVMPSNYIYTIEKVGIKGMYKLAFFVECDGSVTVSDNVQVGDKIKVVIRPDGTASFAGKL